MSLTSYGPEGRGFDLRFAPVVAKRVPLARSNLSHAEYKKGGNLRVSAFFAGGAPDMTENGSAAALRKKSQEWDRKMYFENRL